MRNNLGRGNLARKWGRELILSTLEEAGIPENARGEELEINQVFCLSNLVYSRIGD